MVLSFAAQGDQLAAMTSERDALRRQLAGDAAEGEGRQYVPLEQHLAELQQLEQRLTKDREDMSEKYVSAYKQLKEQYDELGDIRRVYVLDGSSSTIRSIFFVNSGTHNTYNLTFS